MLMIDLSLKQTDRLGIKTLISVAF
jgi:hypothetical protein